MPAFQRIERAIQIRAVRYGIAVFSGGAVLGGVGGGVAYNKAHLEKTPIVTTAEDHVVVDPMYDSVRINMPADQVEDFDCGGETAPIPLLGPEADNPTTIVQHMGARAVVECGLAADVPVIGPDGQPIG